MESPASLYIQPEDRLNYILEEEETEDEEEEEEERITFTIEEEDEEEDCDRFSVNESDDTPSYTVEEEEEERLIPISIEGVRTENSWRFHRNISPDKELDQDRQCQAQETKSHNSLTCDERAAAIGDLVRSQQREVGARLRRNTREEMMMKNTREESVSAIGDLIKDLSAELEQLKQNRRVLESLRRHSSTETPVMSKPPKVESGMMTMGDCERQRKPPRAEFTTYADLLETICKSPSSETKRMSPSLETKRMLPSSAHRQSPSRRHSSVVLPASSLLRELKTESLKPSQAKRFSTSGSSLFSRSACPVVKEEEPCETYSCDQLVIAKSTSLDSLNSATSHSPPSSSPSLSTDSMDDLGSEQSIESELMSDPSSCDELWLLPQQVLAMDVDLLQVKISYKQIKCHKKLNFLFLQAELPLSRSSAAAEDQRLEFSHKTSKESTFAQFIQNWLKELISNYIHCLSCESSCAIQGQLCKDTSKMIFNQIPVSSFHLLTQIHLTDN